MDENMKHKAEEALGKAKSKLGESTDDPSLQGEGAQEQQDAQLKEAGDKARQATEGDQQH